MLKLYAVLLAIFTSAALIAEDELPRKEESKSVQVEMLTDYSMSRDASGTAWQPDSSPMKMIMTDLWGWHFMLHGNVFGGLVGATSARGAYQFMSANWVMAKIQGYIGPGQFSTSAMFSLEPLTVPGSGYPLLFQTGETWQGQRLFDRQHPHNLFMELAVRYQLPIIENLNLDFYVAPVGEPALGPVGFPHRTSAKSNPLAPLGHHWLDATHISFGVLTFGVFGNEWKVEGSWFNGREPGENRYAFELNVPDSYSLRLAYNPIEALSLQASYGYLNEPEAIEPGVGVYRITNSVSGNIAFWEGSNFAAMLAFGMNLSTQGRSTAAGLFEFDFDITPNHTVFGRLEGGTKSGDDLVLAPLDREKNFGLGAVSLGYAYRFGAFWELVPSVGAVGTLDFAGPELRTYYGDGILAGGMVYLQVGIGD